MNRIDKPVIRLLIAVICLVTIGWQIGPALVSSAWAEEGAVITGGNVDLGESTEPATVPDVAVLPEAIAPAPPAADEASPVPNELNTIIGQITGGGIFPCQGEYGGFILEAEKWYSTDFTAARVPLEVEDLSSVLFGMDSNNAYRGNRVPTASGGGALRGEVARMNAGWATISTFSIYQNFTAPGLPPSHIEIGTSVPCQVTAENLSLDTSEIYASSLTDGANYSIGDYWTMKPEEDLPLRVEGGENPSHIVNGNNIKIKTHTLKAGHLRVPNFCFSVVPGQKITGPN